MNFDLSDEKYKKIDQEGLDLLSQMLEIDYEERVSADEILYHEFFDEVDEEAPR